MGLGLKKKWGVRAGREIAVIRQGGWSVLSVKVCLPQTSCTGTSLIFLNNTSSVFIMGIAIKGNQPVFIKGMSEKEQCVRGTDPQQQKQKSPSCKLTPAQNGRELQKNQ